MPRLPIDYSKTIIYKLCCNDVNIKEIYVGHTTDIIRRRQEHKYNCNLKSRKEYNYNVYQFIRANEGWYNWSLIPIEEYPCENVNQARIRERYWIETLQASLNKNIPSRDQKEYREQNKDKIAEKNKEWYENNKDIMNERQKEYRENNKEIIAEKKKEYYEQNKDIIYERQKEYRENNKEIIKEYTKEWYENNKDKILQKQKEYHEQNKDKISEKTKVKFTCDCGSVCRIADKSKHFKTKKHQEYLSTINENRQESTEETIT